MVVMRPTRYGLKYLIVFFCISITVSLQAQVTVKDDDLSLANSYVKKYKDCLLYTSDAADE